MAPHSSTPAWKIPWTEEPGRLQSMGSLRVRHDWSNSLSLFTFMHWRGKWEPTPVFLHGESQGRGSLVGCRLWGRTESDTTEVTQQQQHSNPMFNLLRNCLIAFKEAATFHTVTNCVWGFQFLSLLPNTCCYLSFFIIGTLLGVKWYCIVVLICISLMINSIEQLFMYLPAICVPSLRKCIFRSFSYF